MSALTATVLILLLAPAQKSAPFEEKTLLGTWTCKAVCPDEEVEFFIEDGQRLYNSWLHHRPAMSRAEWTLEGARLTVLHDAEPRHDWEILELSNTRLVLREKGNKAKTIFARVRN